MPEATMTRPRKGLDLLKRLRKRYAALRLTHGVLRLIVLVLTLAWVTFFLDWSLELPVFMRVLQLVASGALILWGLRTFSSGIRRNLTDTELALRVEEAVGGFSESLVTAVQLTDPDNPRRHLYSPVLIERTVREAERRVEGIRARDLLARDGLFLSGFLIVALLGSQILLGVLAPSLAKTYLNRDILLSSERWPREHMFEIQEPTSTDLRLAMGDALPVQVLQTKGRETKVRVEVLFPDGQEEEFPLDRKGENTFRRVFRNVSRPFSFRVHGGDFVSQDYSVDVKSRPRVEEIALTFDYPEYTGLEDLIEPTTDLGGHVKVPEGTRVSFQARASIPVGEVVFHRVWKENGKETGSAESLTPGEDHSFGGSFVADNTGHYYFKLVSEDGFENPRPIHYRIGLIHDSPPVVHIAKPGKDLQVSGQARIQIEIQFLDDYGLQQSELVLRKAAEDVEEAQEIVEVLTPVPLESGGSGSVRGRSQELASVYTLDLKDWQENRDGFLALPGERIEYLARATDAIGQMGTSRTFSLTIVREDDLTRIIQDELAVVRERLEAALKKQKEARSDLEEVRDMAHLAGGALTEKAAPQARHVRMSQETVNTSLEESLERIREEVIARIENNRLEAEVKDLPWINDLKSKIEELLDPFASEVEDDLSALVRDTIEKGATEDQVDAIVQKQRTVEKRLAEVVDELAEWGDIRSMIREIEDLIEAEDRLQKDLKSKLQD